MTEVIEITQEGQIFLRTLVREFLSDNKGNRKGGLYQLFLSHIEKPLLEEALEKARFNQTKAAAILGMSRTCFRYKLNEYFGDKYFRLSSK